MSNHVDPHGPVVIVTGASRGLGAAIAKWLVQTDAAVVLMARSQKMLEQTAAVLSNDPNRILVVAGDVANYYHCARCVKKTIDQFGQVDALVNNAGTLTPLHPIATADPALWNRNIQVNLGGPFNLTHAALGELNKQKGRIINVSSGAAQAVVQGAGAYCVAKAGLNHLTRITAAENPAVTVIAIRPGVVDTQMQATLRREGPQAMPADQAAYYRNLHDNSQLEPPAVPGRSIAWLALYAPPALSGQFVNYDDDVIANAATEKWGPITQESNRP